jgi:hypothetical protein
MLRRKMTVHKTKVVALSSGGGHWIQLLRLRPAFAHCDVTFATVDEGYRGDVDGAPFQTVPDANRWHKVAQHVDVWLTQWPHLARNGSPAYRGSVF